MELRMGSSAHGIRLFRGGPTWERGIQRDSMRTASASTTATTTAGVAAVPGPFPIFVKRFGGQHGCEHPQEPEDALQERPAVPCLVGRSSS